MINHIPFHIAREHKIVFPVDARQGQLVEGQLSISLALIDVANLLNTNDVQAGDFFEPISIEAELSGNVNAEVSVLNTVPIEILSLSGSTLNLATAFNADPNSIEGKFFEFKITRRSPHRLSTFARVDQTAFVPAIWVNGVVPSDLAITNPTASTVLVSWGGSTLLFTPIGSGRWTVEVLVAEDGSIEVVFPDGANPDVELRLTNIAAVQDTLMWTINSDSFNRLGAWLVGRLRTVERVIGDRYAIGGIPVALQALGVNMDRHEHPAGTTAEVLVTILSKESQEPVDLSAAVIFYEGRDCETGEVIFLKQAEHVAAGVVKFVIPSSESDAGTYRSFMQVNLGGTPEMILRTDAFLLRFTV